MSLCKPLYKWFISSYLIFQNEKKQGLKWFLKAFKTFFMKLNRDKWEDISPKRSWKHTNVRLRTYKTWISNGQNLKWSRL